MIILDVKRITKKLKTEFRSPDRPASHFTNKKLWIDCESVFTDRICTGKIIFANNLGVPPVKALIKILVDDYNYPSDTVFTAQEARNLGSLINFVFKDLLGYNSVHPRRTVKLCGVNEGCTFTKTDVGVPDIPEQSVNPTDDNKDDFGEW